MSRAKREVGLGTCKYCGREGFHQDPRPVNEGGGPWRLCRMHYTRALRRSPNLQKAGKVRDGSRSAKIQVRCEPAFKDYLTKLYGDGKVSDACLVILKKTVGWKPAATRGSGS